MTQIEKYFTFVEQFVLIISVKESSSSKRIYLATVEYNISTLEYILAKKYLISNGFLGASGQANKETHNIVGNDTIEKLLERYPNHNKH